METKVGLLHVRRSIYIKALPNEVWQEFTSLESLRAWLGQGQIIHEYDFSPAGKIDLSIEINNKSIHFGGPVVSLIHESEITFEMQWQNDSSWIVPTYWTIRLTGIYGGTQVELFHHGFERLGRDGPDNLQAYEDGWTVNHLSALREIVEAKRSKLLKN